MLSAAFPTVDISGVSCMALLSNPTATRASMYARPDTLSGEPHTALTTDVNSGRLSVAVPSGRSTGAGASVEVASGVDEGSVTGGFDASGVPTFVHPASVTAATIAPVTVVRMPRIRFLRRDGRCSG